MSTPNPSKIGPATARDAIADQMPFVREALTELVAFRSVHSVPGLEEDNADAADWVTAAFRREGVPVEPRETSDGSTSVIGLREPAEGYPTILLYSHFDVQPATDLDNWTSSPWELTERGGRWYGRGAADCKGHVVLHLAVLRALNELAGEHPELGRIGVRVVVEGSEERGGYGLEDLLAAEPELFAADVFLIADSGNDAVGVPSVCTALRGSAPVTVRLRTMEQPMHSGQFGGAAPDALLSLVRLLATLHDDDGLVAVDGLRSDARWEGRGPDAATFAANAGVLEGVDVIGADRGLSPNDLTVARPAITVTGLDAVPVEDAINAVPAEAAAVVHVRVSPGLDPAEAQDALVRHLEANVPHHARMEVERGTQASPFSADTSGPALRRLMDAMADAYGRDADPSVETAQIANGGSIPLCTKLLEHHPDAELALYGIEEPSCRIHSADESVDPTEIASVAAAELLFLARTAAEA